MTRDHSSLQVEDLAEAGAVFTAAHQTDISLNTINVANGEEICNVRCI